MKPKKYLGQHFLTEVAIAEKIVNSLTLFGNYKKLIEVGPGKGILTKLLLLNKNYNTYVIEVDTEAINYLQNEAIIEKNKIFNEDFLKFKLNDCFAEPIAIIGNFPYNISSQILFKILENKHLVVEVVGMFQKEVAKRIVSAPGSKDYGILSVLTQAWYKTEYLFTVNQGVFFPPPKVKSAVIRLQKIENNKFDCNEALFNNIVKTAFNQRRKMLKNALSKFNIDKVDNYKIIEPLLKCRAEDLNVDDYILITKILEKNLL